ncbi:hypothetical protein, partial [Corynebacterium sp.]|uniref:hypothetical protein n=1 Tax=Corynebacterium sp. TaxID=1720 RepID=UPI0027B95ABD
MVKDFSIYSNGTKPGTLQKTVKGGKVRVNEPTKLPAPRKAANTPRFIFRKPVRNHASNLRHPGGKSCKISPASLFVA